MIKKVFIFLFLLLFLPSVAMAADFNVDCSGSGCSSSGVSPLFSSSEVWYPGKVLTKTFSLSNSSGETREMALKGHRTSASSLLEEVFNLSLVCWSKVLWSGSLESFYSLEKVDIGTFNPGGLAECSIRASMDPSANNDYQELSSVFDLDLGFWGEPSGKKDSESVGQVLGMGDGVSAPHCGDSKPGVPGNLNAVALSGGQVSLSWTSPAGSYTYFLVAYSDNETTPKWGNPNVGSGTSYTVSGLGGGDYWFWVRAGNGCMPGDFSGPVHVRVPGEVAGESTVAPGFVEGVLGDKTDISEMEGDLGGGIATEMGQVKGEMTKKSSPWLFWIIFFIFLVLAIRIFFYLRKRRLSTQ
jgi:hypothetical protein